MTVNWRKSLFFSFYWLCCVRVIGLVKFRVLLPILWLTWKFFFWVTTRLTVVCCSRLSLAERTPKRSSCPKWKPMSTSTYDVLLYLGSTN